MQLTAIALPVSCRKETIRKLLRIMKLTTFIMLVFALAASADVHSQRVTLSLKNAPLEKVFREIQKQTGYDFLFTRNMLKDAHPVDVEVKDAPVQEVLAQCLKGQPLDFTLDNNAIVIREKPKEDLSNENVETVRILPPIDITGRITNEQGQPLSGASVIIKRTGHGDIANANGNFTLKNINSDDILVISYVGYKQQKIKVGNITSFTIVMEVATDELDKVQIQAYGTTSRRLGTGNIYTVTAKEIERQPISNPLAAIEGVIPGVVINQTSGYASAPFKVEIRGRSSINPDLPSEPLYIVDGVPLTILNLGNEGNYATGSVGITQNGFSGPAGGQSPLYGVNPGDIESITVLKDADATSIYGSRGANGVIIITTKRGISGKVKVEGNLYYGVSHVPFNLKLMNTSQYLRMRREAFKNDGIDYLSPYNASQAFDLVTWDTTRYTNWQKEIWGKTGQTADVQLSLSGGERQTTFRVAGSLHREVPILISSGADQRESVQLNFTNKSLNQRLTTSITSSYSYGKINIIRTPNAFALPPDAPSIYNSTGNLNWRGWAPEESMFIFGGNRQPYSSNTSTLNSKLFMQYEIFQGLIVSANGGYMTIHNSQIYVQPIASKDPSNNPTGSSRFGNNNNTNTIFEPQLNYKKASSWGKLDALIGASVQSIVQDGNILFASGFLNDHLLYSAAGAPYTSGSNGYAQYKYAALFGRLNYNWKDKYILDLTARRDGSSRFGPGKQFGNFGSIAGAWIFSEEHWSKKILPFLSFGKIRTSYGTSGSDPSLNYQYLSQWVPTMIPYGGNTSYQSSLLPNPNLEWQSNRKFEVAINLGFLHDRLTFEIARYQDRCGNQLILFPLPQTTGFAYIMANSPALIQNLGWEGIMKYQIIETKSFNWAFNFNFGTNRNKLLKYPDLPNSPYAALFSVGKSLNIIRLLHYTGVDPQTGLYTFQDKNKDGVITTDYNNGDNDLYEKDLSVKYQGAFGTELRYKGFQLNLLFVYSNELLNNNLNTGGTAGNAYNQSVKLLNHWQKPGDKAQFARYTTGQDITDINWAFFSDAMYSNTFYIKLRNLALSYDIQSKKIQKAGFSNIQIYLHAENILTFTKYDGDPESPNLLSVPRPRTYVFGIQFSL